MAKGLTFTAIFEAQSLNYDEGFGNLSVLKKLRRGNGNVFTVASRQSLRYSIFTQGVRQFDWKPSSVELSGTGDNKVIQHIADINESEEVDLFGYMKTSVPIKKNDKGEVEKSVTITRRMPVRITPAISLEPFFNDVEMLTNKYQSDKKHEQPNIANMEQHRSLYRYTVAIDLDRIGNEKDEIGTHISPNTNVNTNVKTDYNLFKKAEEQLHKLEVDKEIRCRRVQQLLEVIKNLHRHIRGRTESLSPLFIIGGVYDCQNPFFINVVCVEYQKGKPRLMLEPLKQILSSKYSYSINMTEKLVHDSTYLGICDGYFSNSTEEVGKELFPKNNGYDSDHVLSPDGMIDKLKQEACKCFPGHNHSKETDNASS